jgi:aminoglycoside phosphotransferase (APT) family kinase protein
MHVRESRRWLLAFVGADGDGVVVKLGPPEDDGLAREVDTVVTLGGKVGETVRAPVLRWHGKWNDWVGLACGAFTRSCVHVGLEDGLVAAEALATTRCGFVVHGDLAPWNMVPTAKGLALIDWEASRFDEDPLADLAHFVVSSGVLLGAWEPEKCVSLLVGEGSVGWRYLKALGLDPRTAPDHLVRYLQRRQPEASPVWRRYGARMAPLLTAQRGLELNLALERRKA